MRAGSTMLSRLFSRAPTARERYNEEILHEVRQLRRSEQKLIAEVEQLQKKLRVVKGLQQHQHELLLNRFKDAYSKRDMALAASDQASVS